MQSAAKKNFLPIYWGNRRWISHSDGLIVPSEEIVEFSEGWIDYERAVGESSDLCKDSSPDAKLRHKLHKQILDRSLAGADQYRAENPSCVLTHGGIASGKTSAIQRFLEASKGGYLHIDFDRMKRELPEFEYMTGRKIKKAAEYVQEESAKLAGKLLKRAIPAQYNIIYEGSLASLEVIGDRIRQMRRKKYEITVVATFVSEATGQRRATDRYQAGGRFVPRGRVAETYKNCPKTLVGLKDLVDIVLLFDNEIDDRPARPVLVIQGGKCQILDKTLYDGYLKAVGKENRLN